MLHGEREIKPYPFMGRPNLGIQEGACRGKEEGHTLWKRRDGNNIQINTLKAQNQTFLRSDIILLWLMKRIINTATVLAVTVCPQREL